MMPSLHLLKPRSLKHVTQGMWRLLSSRLWLKILVGLLVGVLLGIALGPDAGVVSASTAATIGSWAALPGMVFLAMLQMIVVPLVIASIIRGLAASEDMEQLKRIGPRLFAYFITTTAVAISVGMLVTHLIGPGRLPDGARLPSVPPLARGALETTTKTVQTTPELISSIIPQNPLQAMLDGQMVQIVIFAIIAGVALVSLRPSDAKPLLDLLGSLQRVCMTIVNWTMRLAPLAVVGLMMRVISQLGITVLVRLAAYMGTVLLGLAILLAIYLALVAVVGRTSPLTFLRKIRDVQLLAFSTSSSAAAMPLSIRAAEERLGVRPSIAQLLIPLGSTVNMDGTALYQGVATLFLAQLFGIDLGIGQLALVVVTATLASIGAPSTPGAGIVILGTVLHSVGIPSEGIALIIGVDRLLDMSRTAVNVSGDLTACVVMDRWIGGKRTAKQEREEEAELEARRRSSGEDVILVER